jgi:AhpD family alkylhydroperoxidase
VSQLNGCAFCLDMHAKDARARGETEQRLYVISAWREVPHLYTARERAALASAEAVTGLEHQEVPDAVYDLARHEFTDVELSQLTGSCRDQWLEPLQRGVPHADRKLQVGDHA